MIVLSIANLVINQYIINLLLLFNTNSGTNIVLIKQHEGISILEVILYMIYQ